MSLFREKLVNKKLGSIEIFISACLIVVMGSSAGWADDKYDLGAELRLRSQTVEQEGKDKMRLFRMQAKVNLSGKVDEDLKLVLQLLTGTSASSGNQTLGDSDAPGMPRRNFALNLGYIDYQPVKDITLLGGKTIQPFYFVGKNQMLLDKDIMPEGFALKYKMDAMEDVKLGINAGTFIIKEQYDNINGSEQTDNMLNGFQIFTELDLEIGKLLLGYGQYSFTGFKDNTPKITGNFGKVDNITSHGNTLDPLGNYPTNFDLQEGFIELKSRFGDFETGIFLADIKNIDAESLNTAQDIGFSLGYGIWSFTIAQLHVEKDAVVGAFTDSDFNDGDTSAKGTILGLGCKVTKNVQVNVTQYQNSGQIDSLQPRSYARTHMDLTVLF